MPTDRIGKEDASSSSKHTRKTSVKDAPSSPGTAPLLPGAKSKKTAPHKKVIHTTKKHAVKHVKIVHKRATKVAIQVAHGYKKADAKAIHTAKRVLPERTLNQLAANRTANNGNLKFSVPVSKKTGRKVPVIIPKSLKHIRHAAVPGALAAVLFFAFGFVGASPPGYGGTKIMGGSGVDRATQVITDANDNVYMIGAFDGTVNFGADWSTTDNKTSTDADSDIFITKSNANGSYGWTKRIPSSAAGAFYNYKIATDSTGVVYVAGAFEGTVNFAEDWGGTDEKVSAGSTDGFLTKINSDGTYGWTKQIGGTTADSITGIAVDSSNALTLSGTFTGTVTFDTDFGTTDWERTSAGQEDVFVARVNNDGTFAGMHQIGSTSTERSGTTVVASNGDSYVMGTCNSSINLAGDWEGGNDTKVCSANTMFITKINSDDSYGWSKIISTGALDPLSAAAFDKSGNLYIGGSLISSSVNFAADWGGSDSKTKTGNGDGFVTKINANGTYGWTHVFGGVGASAQIASVVTDADDNIYVSGLFGSSVNFAADWGGSDSKVTDGINGFITRINANDSYGWTVVPSLGTDSVVEMTGIAVDSQNALYSTGSFTGVVNFANDFADTDEKTSNGESDIFFTKITTVEVLHKVGDATGLTYKDGSGTNLSSTGTSDAHPTVYIHDQDDETVLATIGADLSEDRDWSSVSGDSDTGAYKMFVNNAIGAPGADTSMTLYVPKNTGDNAVILCPGAEDLSSVSKTCANKRTLTTHDAGVTTGEISGTNYWVVANVTDQKIGGMSTSFPSVSMTATDSSTSVTEGGSGDYVAVVLNAQPTADVTVTLTTDPDNQLEAIDPITFTTSNWNTPVNVYVEAVNDNTIEGNHSVNLGYSVASTDEYYNETSESNVVTVDITDNDQAGVVLHNTDNVITESNDSTEICATLTARPAHDVTLNLATSDTSETSLPGSITITPTNWNNQSANCFTVESVDDNEVDGPKNSNISVSSITSDDTNFASLDTGTISPIVITTEDDDATGFIVTATDTTTTEAGGSIDVCIKLTARPNSSVTIPVSSSDTSEGSLGAMTTLVIAPASWNSNSNCVTVTGVDDDMVDGNINYTLTTGDPTSADPTWDALDANAVADQNLTNEDNDTAGITITQTSGTTAITEGGATDSFDVVLTSQPAPSKQVVVAIQPDTEIDLGSGAGQPITKTFTESDWNTPQPVTVTAVNDTSVEGNHTGVISITVDPETTETPYLGLDEQTITAAITDNDIATASIATVGDANENPSSNGLFRISLDHQNDTGSDMTFTYSIGGTAVSGTHYTALSGSATIPSGSNSADITLDVSGHNNTLLEGNKTVIVTLSGSSNPSAQISESNNTATVAIFDDERATASLSKTQDGAEDGPTAVELTVTLSTKNDTGAPITVDVASLGGAATSGSDYQLSAGDKITVPNGATAGTIMIPVLDDSDFEPLTETLSATIANPSINLVTIDSENNSAEATITDNDTAKLNITATTPTANENPSSNGIVTFALNKTNSTGSGIQVSYTVSGTATADSDYDSLSGSVTIPNGQQSATATINTSGHNDEDMEGNETVVLTYDSNSLPSRVNTVDTEATVTIVDDETASITATATDDTTGEDGSTGQICFTLASRPSADVVVVLTSSDTNKVTVPNSITIERDNWNNANANCVTATGHDDTPPAATGTQDVSIQTTGVTSDDPFYSTLTGDDIADITMHHADNDTPGITVHTVSDKTKEDGSKTAVVEFSLATKPSGVVTIPVSVSDATEGSIGVTEVTIDPKFWNNPGANTLTISGVDDHLTDGDITYQLVTGDPTSSDALYNALDANDVTNPSLINEDDDAAGITVSETDDTTAVTEGGINDMVNITLHSQPAPGNEVTVRIDPNGEIDLGSGAGQPITKTFTESDWNVIQSVTVAANDDGEVEGDHSGNFVISVDETTTEDAYHSVGNQTVNVAITDNDVATATIAKISDAQENPSQNGRFRVTLDKTNHTGNGMVFKYSISGSAIANTHYAQLPVTVTIPDNADAADIVVDVSGHDNTLLEGNKTITIILGNSLSPSGAISDSNNAATLTIADDERATVSLDATQNGNEAGPVPVVFTASLSKQNDTGSPITVTINPSGGNATNGSDYQDFSNQTITIPSGSSSGTLEVPVLDDAVFEAATETVAATLTNPSSNLVTIDTENDSAQATIADDETAELNVVASQPNAAENPHANGTITFNLDKVNNTGNNIDITYTISGTATANSDYDALSGAVSIPNGQQSASVTINTSGHDDNDMEGDETVIVTYSNNNVASRVSIGGATAATVTIADDETAGVNVNVTDNSTSENGATGQICFTLASRPNSDVTINLASSDSAKVTVPASVTVTRNNWNSASASCVTVTGHDDTPPEVTGTQNVTIQTTGIVSSDPFYSALTGNDIADATINHADNDTPGIEVHAVSDHTKEDGSKTAVVRFELATQPTDTVVIPVSVSDSTEGNIGVSTIAITPENWNVPSANEVTISGVDDNLIDGDISYTFQTGDPTSSDISYNALGANDVDNVTLVNEDDDQASVSITQSGGSTAVTEGGATDTVNISIGTQPAAGKQVVIRATPADTQLDIGGGAGAAVDVTFTNSNWGTPQTLTITALDDTLLESTHTSQITYAIKTADTTEDPYKNYSGSLPATPVTITDNDTATADFTVGNGSEAGPTAITATVTLSKQNDTSAPITFTLNPNGGSATAITDYANFANTTVSIPVGQTSATVQIGVVDDALLEGDETVGLALTNPSLGSVSITNGNRTATITDNDSTTATVVATDPSASENPATNGEFTVYLGKVNNTGAPIAVNYTVSGSATAGQDYDALSGTVSIPNGASSVIIPVTTAGHDDGTVENNETVIVTLQSTSHGLVSIGNPSSATVTIADDDGFTTTITKLDDGHETGPSNIRFRVQLSQVNATGSPFTVHISDTNAGSATSGSDYQAFGGTINIPNGQQYADYSVTVIDDADLENIEETVEAKLENPSEGELGIDTATATITDNETANVTVTATQATAHENPASDGEFTISLDKENKGTNPILITYTVNGTAVSPDDYATLSGTAMIAPGTSDTVVTVNTAGRDDSEHEGNETVILSLSSTDHPNISIGNPSSATVTIIDDDPEPQNPPTDNNSGGNNSGSGSATPVQATRHVVTMIPVTAQAAEETAKPETTPIQPKPQPVDQKLKDLDGDGTPDEEENKANNDGDGNGDGIPDSQQDSVTSVISKITNKSVTLEARGECSAVESFKVVSEDALHKQDRRYKYPFGLVDYKLQCAEPGQSGIVTVYYDQTYENPGNWRKFSPGSETFKRLDFAKNLKQPVGKNKVTSINYIIRDGGEQDDDGKQNGKIADPAGFATRAFYILDAGWAIPVLLAGWFVGYSLWHRAKDHRRYR